MMPAPALPGNEALRANGRAWVKRRARRLVRAFQITRREAVANAVIDWLRFRPEFNFVTVTKTTNTHTQHA